MSRGETFLAGARRELGEETLYTRAPIESFEMLGQFHSSMDDTRTEGIVGVYSQLDWDKLDERYVVRDILSGQGGLTAEKERTRSKFVLIEEFLAVPDMTILFRTALATFTDRIAQRTGDEGPKLACSSAFKKLGL